MNGPGQELSAPVRLRAGFSGEKVPVYFERMDPLEPSGLPPVLMLHGGLHTGACYQVTVDGRPGWSHLFAARGHPVLVPDWPGHGRSGAGCASSLTGEVLCQAMARLVRELDSPIILVTHSMGGAMGWRLLELCKDRIVALVALAPGPPGNLQPEPDILEDNESSLVIQTLAGTITIQRDRDFIADRAWALAKLIGPSTRFPRQHLESYLRSLTPANARLVAERQNVFGTQVRVREPRGLAGKPVVVVTGTHDTDHSRTVDAEIVTWLKASGVNASHMWLGDLSIVGNGHMLMLESNSDEVCNAVLDWIGQKLCASLST